jgi:molybdopterin synthase catalytic subunit
VHLLPSTFSFESKSLASVPVSRIHLSDEPLDVQACIEAASAPAYGGVNVFVGTVRDATQGRPVLRLEYEAYAPMALREMQRIADDVHARWDGASVVIHHRTGTLAVGEAAVVIVVATPHRAASFEACRYAIDTLKTTVPIWKKEVFSDGEIWVTPHA